MIEGEGSWRSQGRDVSCLITMSSASLSSSLQIQTARLMRSRTPLFTEMHRRIEMLRSRLANISLSISVDIVARCRASSPPPPSKKREECRRILESSTRAFESFKLTKLLPLFLRCYVISSSSSFSSSFFFRCFLFFFLLFGKEEWKRSIK